MSPFPKPSNEAKRLEALAAFEIMDTPPEEMFEELVEIAAHVCRTPIALISMLDEERQWFKARIGLDAPETARDAAFCAHAIMGNETMVVEDATKDARFADNPLVLGDPNIRFYAGAPMVTEEGYGLGTLCVIDEKPRTLSDAENRVLQALSRQATRLIEYRRTTRQLATALEEVKLLGDLIPMCAWCGRVREDEHYWVRVGEYLEQHAGTQVTHGICPDCATKA